MIPVSVCWSHQLNQPSGHGLFPKSGTLKMIHLKSVILQYVQHLKQIEKYNTVEGYHYWDIPNTRGQGSETTNSGNCTNGARIIANKFGGSVFGYFVRNNPNALVGRDTFGHDFALVGHFLVDYWAWQVSCDLHTPVLHTIRDRRTVEHFYGNPDYWSEVKAHL